MSTTAGKNQLYDLITANGSGAVTMTATDKDGKTYADQLAVGLYLIVEVQVSPDVTVTTNQFLVSIPMTDSDGTGWNYDVNVYPKNETDTELEPNKEVRVNTADNSNDYSDYVSATTGDVLDYSIGMTIGKISDEATYYTSIKATDNHASGLTYVTDSVSVSFYASETAYDHGNGTALFTWGSTTSGSNTYYTFDGTTFTVTSDGLAEVNYDKTLLYKNTTNGYQYDTTTYSGYTDLYMVITYQMKVTDASAAAGLTYGDQGNVNTVTVEWKRTNGEEDKHDDAAIVFYYGIDLTKLFDGAVSDSLSSSVEFILQKTEEVDTTAGDVTTEGKPSTVYIVAKEVTTGSGVYYVTGTTTDETKATHFTPNATSGVLQILGLDGTYATSTESKVVHSHVITYTLTEVKTAKGYNLLEEPVIIEITSAEAEYTPGYYTYLSSTDNLTGATWHSGVWELTQGSSAVIKTSNENEEEDATWDEKSLSGTSDTYGAETATSYNVTVLLEINNTKGFTLPLTGGMGTMLIVIIGAVIICLAVVVGNRSKKRKAA